MIVIDFQGLKKNGKFYFKEITINNNNEYNNYLIKGPTGRLEDKDYFQYKWLMKYHHAIKKEYGSINFKDILWPDGTIYVKGQEKKKILNKYINNEIINIEDLGIEKIKVNNDLGLECEYMKHNQDKDFPYCSLKRVYTITKLLSHYKYNF